MIIAQNYIHLDHEQQKTASGGVAYLWNDTRFSADFLLGSGLRADLELPPGETTAYGGTSIPNGEHLPYYTQVNTGITHVFTLPAAGTLTARFDAVNLFDKIYQIRNGTGVGVGAPQCGPPARTLLRSVEITLRKPVAVAGGNRPAASTLRAGAEGLLTGTPGGRRAGPTDCPEHAAAIRLPAAPADDGQECPGTVGAHARAVGNGIEQPRIAEQTVCLEGFDRLESRWRESK